MVDCTVSTAQSRVKQERVTAQHYKRYHPRGLTIAALLHVAIEAVQEPPGPSNRTLFATYQRGKCEGFFGSHVPLLWYNGRTHGVFVCVYFPPLTDHADDA